ncbi:non-ribosomal peptide synthetase [Pleionea sediminis]|uniref:non-ribosomal peptide synthetase n=1 Tax=Pleionea sediminis TaxID=2569479 RepID=UPI00197BF291|nr:non-ribosomal peptide synthetase [Pleionea sediminis]
MTDTPLTANGKIDRQRLPVATKADYFSDDNFVIPKGKIEQKIAASYSEVLGHSSVGALDNFFDLGGDSLSALKVIRSLKDKDVDVSLRDLMISKTPRALAELIRKEDNSAELEVVYSNNQTQATQPFSLLSEDNSELAHQGYEDVYPVSKMQWAMLLHSNDFSSTQIYHDVLSYQVNAPFCLNSMKKALEDLVGTHDILRSKIIWDKNDEPHIALGDFLPTLTVESWLEFDDDQQESKLEQWMADESNTTFNFSDEVPLRIFVHQLSATKFQLSLSFHHAILDGWSESIVTKTLLDTYQVYRQGDSPELTVPKYSFAQHVANENSTAAVESVKSFWKSYLSEVEPHCFEEHSKETTYSGLTTRSIIIDEPLRQKLRVTAERLGVSIKSVLLAAHVKCLSLLTGRQQIVTGLVTNCRAADEHADTSVGMFLNTVPFQAKLLECSWDELILRCFENELDVLPNRYLPLSDINKVTHVGRWFDTLFNYTKFERFKEILNHPESLVIDKKGIASNGVPFFVDFDETEHLTCRLMAHKNTKAEAFQENYVQIIEDILSAATQSKTRHYNFVSCLANQWLPEFKTPIENSYNFFLDELFLRASNMSDKTALITGITQVSYSELIHKVMLTGRKLQVMGVKPGDRVAICLPRNERLIESILAVLYCGAAFVPVDASYPITRNQTILSDANISILLYDEEESNDIAALVDPSQRVSLQQINQKVVSEKILKWAPYATFRALPAYLIYTSGSTGTPKGVILNHGNLAAFLGWGLKAFTFEQLREVAFLTSNCFDLSIYEMFLPLLTGGTVHIYDNVDAFSESSYQEVTLINTVPSAIKLLLELNAISDKTKTINLAGEPLRKKLVNQLFAETQVDFINNLYGPSEATVYATQAKFNKPLKDEPSIGQGVDSCRIYLLDETLHPVPDDCIGELYVAGDSVGFGYLNRSKKSAESFLPDPYSNNESQVMYRTGDLAIRRNDEFIFVGRRDSQVKVKGFRIELGDIETACMKQSEITDVAVVVTGEPDSAHLYCFYVGNTETAALHDFLAKQLPHYMVPSYYQKLDKMPLTSTGKIDRKSLLSGITQIQDEASEQIANQQYLDKTTAMVADLVHELIGQQPAPDQSFFSIGGDSISAMQLASRCRRLGYKLSVKDIFKLQTVTAIANYLDSQMKQSPGKEDSLSTNLSTNSPIPLTPIQHWYLNIGKFAYHQVLGIQVNYPGEPLNNLVNAINIVMQRHPSLVSKLTKINNHYHLVPGTGSINIRTVKVNQVEEKSNILQSELQALHDYLDIDEGRMIGALWLEGEGLTCELWLVIHHFVVDAVSWNTLIDDIREVYSALAVTAKENAKESIVEQTDITQLLPFSDPSAWCHQLSKTASSSILMQEYQSYWSQLKGISSAVFGCYNNKSSKLADTRNVQIQLSKLQSNALQEVAATSGGSLLSLIVTSVSKALKGFTDNSQVGLLIETHGRDFESSDITPDRLVNWLTGFWPLWVVFDESDSIKSTFAKVAESLNKPVLRGSGYGLLRYLHPKAAVRESMAEIDLPQVSLNYLGKQSVDQDKYFSVIPGSLSAYQDPETPRQTLLDINVALTGENLTFDLSYADDQVSSLMIKEFGQKLEHTIQQIINELPRKKEPELPFIPNENFYRLTATQKGLLYHYSENPSKGDYVIQAYRSIKGNLDKALLHKACCHVGEKYEALRTVFIEHDDEFIGQKFEDKVEVFWQEVDWSKFSHSEIDELLTSFLDKDRQQEFVKGKPWHRFTLIKAHEEHFLVWTIHHALVDGWSIGVVLADIQTTYDSLESMHSKDELVCQFSNGFSQYLEYIRTFGENDSTDYWRQYLLELQEYAGKLPMKMGEVSKQPIIERCDSQLSMEVSNLLKEFSREHQITINTILQAAWGILISRYSCIEEVVFGVTVSGRPPELEGVEKFVGPFINTVPVRVNCFTGQTTEDMLTRLQNAHIERMDVEHVSLAEIQKSIGLYGESALFETIFVYENYPMEQDGSQSSIQWSRLYGIEQNNYPLAVAIVPGEQLSFRLTADGRRFDAKFLQQMAEDYALILKSLMECETVQTAVEVLKPLPHHMENDFNPLNNFSRKQNDHSVSVLQMLEKQVIANPEQTAIVFDNLELNYQDFDQLTNSLANRLLTQGNSPVVVQFKRSIEAVVAMFACFKAGRIYVPVDPQLPTQLVNNIIRENQVQLVLGTRVNNAELDCEQLEFNWSSLTNSQHFAGPILNGKDIAYIIHTSGSTGKPKGVAISHQSIALSTLSRLDFYDTQSERFSFAAGFHFDSCLAAILGSLCAGKTLIIPTQSQMQSIDRMVNLIEEQKVENFLVTPSLYRAILEHNNNFSFSNLKHVVLAGESVYEGLIQTHLKNTTAQLHVEYGPTEAAVWASGGELTGASGDSVIGKPILNSHWYVLDQQLNPVPKGVAGELYLGGPNLAQGYVNMPGMTASRFIPNPFSTGERLYRTGDIVCELSKQGFKFLGRSDRQLKIRGYRIEPEAVESTLLSLANLEGTAVFEFDKQLVAAVVSDDDNFSEGDNGWKLRNKLRGHLPEYAIPDRFIKVDELPLTRNGKADMAKLRELAKQLVSLESKQSESELTSIQQRLINVFEEVLGRTKVQLDDNFFGLGGDSIKALSLATRAQKLGVSVEPSQIMQYPTVRHLAQVAEERENGFNTQLTIDPVKSGESISGPNQNWFFEHNHHNPNHWNQAVSITLQQFSEQKIKSALRFVFKRHDVFRLSFTRQTTNDWQAIYSEEASYFSFRKEANISDARRLELICETQASLNLEEGRLNACLLIEKEESQELIVCLHHLIVDVASWRILVDEIQAYLKGELVDDGPSWISYQQWTRHQKDWVTSADGQECLNQWNQALPEAVSQLKVSNPEAEFTYEHATTEKYNIALDSISPSELEPILIASLVAAVSEQTQSPDLVIWREHNGRATRSGELSLAQTMGWFTALHPLIFYVDGFQNLVEEVRNTMLDPLASRQFASLMAYSEDKAFNEKLNKLKKQSVVFNFFGDISSAKASQEQLSYSLDVPFGADIKNSLSAEIQVLAAIDSGELTLQITYSEARWSKEDVSQLISRYLELFNEFMGHDANELCELADVDLDLVSSLLEN